MQEIYCFDKELSDQAQALVIRVGEGKLDGFALTAFKENPTKRIQVPFRQSFKKIVEIGKLYFQGKQLIIDAYGRATFHWRIEPAANGQLCLSARLKINGKEIGAEQCDFVCLGSPAWFIKGISLCAVEIDIPESFKSVLKEPRCFSGSDLQELLEKHLPSIEFLQNSKELLQQSCDPVPVLILKDRTGAFADLWMDYGNGKRVSFNDVAPSKRKKAVEAAWEKDLLETDFIRKFSGTSHYYCPMDRVAKSLSFLLEVGWNIEDWKGNRVVQQKDAKLSMHSRGKSIHVQGKIHYDRYEADIADVVGAFNRRDRFVQLGSGVVGLLPQKWEQTGLNGIEEAEIVGKDLEVSRSHFGSMEALWNSPSVEVDPDLALLRDSLKSFTGIQTVHPGDLFKGELRPYQQEGLNWLAFLHQFGFHGILADDMGLGKTVQVLAFLSTLKREALHLIVLPTSLIFNWKREIERFLPDYPLYVHHGSERQESGRWPVSGIILTSYSTLRMNLSEFKNQMFECIIVDEAQAIKNPQTQLFQAVCGLKGNFRLSITGTPIENSLSEVWAHFHFLMPDLLGSKTEFEGAVQAVESDPRHLQRIKMKLRPFILRRTKDVVKLPERIDQVVWVEMEPSQRKVYEDFLAGVRGNLFKKVEVDGMAKHRMEVLEAILRLRQICCHPLLVAQAETAMESAKLNLLLEDLWTVVAEKRKAIVYSQFTSMLGLIAKEISNKGYRHVKLDGSTVDRESVVNQFQKEEDIPLFLISLKAGGVGLNLTAADYVFLYDPWWNEAVEEQAINRAHRIGRHDTVVAKRYVVAESIEEKMMKLKAAKRVLVDSLMDNELASAKLTEEDFRFLLS